MKEYRIKELESYFWDETNDEETTEWREDLNEEELNLVAEWDKRIRNGMITLCKEIQKTTLNK